MHTTLRFGFGFGLLCLAAVGCAGGDGATEQPLGSIDLAVQTTGPDGATYRLTGATVLWVQTPDYAFSDALRIDGAQPVQNFDLPPNDYVANVVSTLPDGAFEIERSDGTQTELLHARYLGVNPTPFSIVADRSTSLTLPFSVSDIGAVTFETGHLAVDLNVDFDSEAPNRGQVTLNSARIDAQTFGGALTDAEEYVAPSNASVTQTSAWDITGPFALTGNRRACAPIVFTSSVTSEPEWGDLIAAVPGSVGQLCVIDDTYGDRLIIESRQHPDFQGLPIADLLAGSDYEVLTSVTGNLPPTVFDGTTLHLDQLANAASQGDLNSIYWLVDSTNGETQAELRLQGPGDVQTWTQ